jgi:hypothetical protein
MGRNERTSLESRISRSGPEQWEGHAVRPRPAVDHHQRDADTGERVAEPGEEERKILLDCRVYNVPIIVEPTGKRRASTRSAAVVLRTAPNGMKFLELDRQAIHCRRQLSQD